MLNFMISGSVTDSFRTNNEKKVQEKAMNLRSTIHRESFVIINAMYDPSKFFEFFVMMSFNKFM